MKFFYFILCLFSLSFLYAEEELPTLEINQLQDNFYVYTTFKPVNDYLFPSNSMYIVGNDGVILIDTPWDTTQTQALLDSIQIKHKKNVTACIVTHFHDDRTAALDILKSKGVKTYSSSFTKQLCIQRKEKTAEFEFSKDTAFSIQGIEFTTYFPGAGHTKDNILIWFPEMKILFGGCFIKSTDSQGLGNIADADVAEWLKSITKVKEKFHDAKYVIPGHQNWGGSELINHTESLISKALKKE